MKRLSLISVLLCLAALALLSSCGGTGASSKGGSDDPVAAPTLVIKQPSTDYSKGSQFISVQAYGAWNISVSASWVKVQPASGSGTVGNVVLSYEENTSEETRSCTLTVSSGSKSSSYTFTQGGKTSSGGGGEPGGDEPGGDEPGGTEGGGVSQAGWLELPAMTSTPGYDFFHHKMTFGGRTERNYSFYYSYSDLVSLWVAYPLVKAHSTNASGRTNEWGFDPLIPSNKQPVLFNAYRGSYDRGHQLPSADRTADRSMNVSTFYFTNMTPQNNTLNGGVWATLENKVRGWASSSDTLYVVTGCVVDGSTAKAYDNSGKAVTVPTGYYKAFLRYAKNSTLGFDGYMAGAVYFNHTASATGQVMSVDALETRLGMDFFPNLTAVVGQATADKIEAQDPKTVSWWGL